MNLPAVDWIFLAVLLVSLVVGAWRGFVYELISLASWLAAFVLAQWFAPAAAQWLPMSGSSEALRYAAGFVLVFIAAIFAGGLIAFLAKKLLAVVGLRPADRVLGAGFGLVRGALLLLAFTAVVSMTPLRTATWWQEASGPQVSGALLLGIRPLLPQEFSKYLPE